MAGTTLALASLVSVLHGCVQWYPAAVNVIYRVVALLRAFHADNCLGLILYISKHDLQTWIAYLTRIPRTL